MRCTADVILLCKLVSAKAGHRSPAPARLATGSGSAAGTATSRGSSSGSSGSSRSLSSSYLQQRAAWGDGGRFVHECVEKRSTARGCGWRRVERHPTAALGTAAQPCGGCWGQPSRRGVRTAGTTWRSARRWAPAGATPCPRCPRSQSWRASLSPRAPAQRKVLHSFRLCAGQSDGAGGSVNGRSGRQAAGAPRRPGVPLLPPPPARLHAEGAQLRGALVKAQVLLHLGPRLRRDGEKHRHCGHA